MHMLHFMSSSSSQLSKVQHVGFSVQPPSHSTSPLKMGLFFLQSENLPKQPGFSICHPTKQQGSALTYILKPGYSALWPHQGDHGPKSSPGLLEPACKEAQLPHSALVKHTGSPSCGACAGVPGSHSHLAGQLLLHCCADVALQRKVILRRKEEGACNSVLQLLQTK